jgi:glycosyltransferase involved in cell wall biosynthesis
MTGMVLFYKRLVTLGGAEVLLGQHYAWLRAQGRDVTVICFEAADLDRIAIEPADLVVLPGRGAVAQTRALAAELRARRGTTVICHSGYIELGVAAWMASVDYAVFVHQPTTMSFNEQDKFAARFWPRYCAFARHDAMFDRLAAQRAALSLPQRAYVEARSLLSQAVLRRARALFVLSDYAVRAKAAIFGLRAVALTGAIPPDRVAALASKPDLRPVSGPVELVSVSRIDENKRIEILIDAVAELRARGRDVRLRLGGKGPATEALRAHAAARGVAGAVTFLGFVPESEIPALYAGMDLFVTIDWADFRITTYEGLAENRRVIVSDDTDTDPALLASGYLFTSPPEARALADTIDRALVTPVTWDRARLADYLGRFTWPVYFSQIAAALGQGVEGRTDAA